jgi:multidrug resistance efflux pump
VASRSRVRVEEQELFEVRARRARTTTTLARLKHDVAERRRLAADAQDDIQPMLVRLERAQELVRRATIRAPVAGTLVRLAVLHPGSVMGTGEPVVVLEPDDQPLLARVDVPNASMRRLREGLAGRIELDAFPREDFGHIRGEVLDIEPDADDTGRYRAWIQLTPDATTNETLVRGLKPGLHLDVRLIVERRRIIDFLARPLRKLSGPLTVTE